VKVPRPDPPAAVSYRRRIVAGPAFTVDHALGREILACHA
jgi:hypothetical protein